MTDVHDQSNFPRPGRHRSPDDWDDDHREAPAADAADYDDYRDDREYDDYDDDYDYNYDYDHQYECASCNMAFLYEIDCNEHMSD